MMEWNKTETFSSRDQTYISCPKTASICHFRSLKGSISLAELWGADTSVFVPLWFHTDFISSRINQFEVASLFVEGVEEGDGPVNG